jgi:hypothetical protein
VQFRSKPKVIEAIQTSEAIRLATADWASLPPWLLRAYESGDVLFARQYVSISTLEGTMRANREDWIIRGIQGEIYPCKPDIFAATYEPVTS